MDTSVALFTRDLRLADNPMLSAARAADRMIPLFVLDGAILRGPAGGANRAGFLAECLAALRTGLRRRGSDLVVRAGDPVEEVARLAAEVRASAVHIAGDVSGYARRREERLRGRLAGDGVVLQVHPDSLFVVPPGAITPHQGDHMAVFTPYHRRWTGVPARDPHPTPRRLPPVSVPAGRLPTPGTLGRGTASPDRPAGGEPEGRRRMLAWLRDDLPGYGTHHDDLADDATSRLSPYLHFGCVSPQELRARAEERGGPGAAAFVRQLAWRDFHAQVLAARPDAARVDYRDRFDRWEHDTDELAAWREGRTGMPIVDAGMRQLIREGWMHNRTRMLVAHYLTKVLYLDWRAGADHFADLLVDADVANNAMNWQWSAGTGTDTRPNRRYNLVRQARRYDPDGAYVRRYVPELASVDGPAVHEPWRLPEDMRSALNYPEPLIDPGHAHDRFRAARL